MHMRWLRLACVLAVMAAARAPPAPAPDAAPGRWRFDDAVAGGGPREARRISAPAGGGVNVVPAVTSTSTSTTPAPRTKKLVTLAPGGDNIQAILFNNGYRDRPADAEPEPNNIDDDANLDGLDRRDVWLLDDNLLVLKGGAFSGGFSDTEPLDDFQAPYREPKFPPPEFLGEGELPPGLLGAWQLGFPVFPDPFGPPGSSQPLGPEQTFGYQPYGRPEPRPYTGPIQPLDPEQRVGYSPHGRPELRPETQPEAQPKTQTETQPESGPQSGHPYNGQSYGERRQKTGGGRVRYPMDAPSVGLQLPTVAPGRDRTFSVSTSYSSTSSESSTSITGPDGRYLPPPRDGRRPDPR